MKLKLKLDTTGVTKMQRAMAQDQIPFATSVALNDVAGQAQREQHNHIGRVFKVTRPGFSLRSIKHKPRATKRQLWTELKVEPPGGAARADILSKFEEGGVKRPVGQRIAIPADVRKGAAGGVMRGQRPGDFGVEVGAAGKRRFKLRGSGPKAQVFVGDKRTFMIQTHDGKGAIFQRVGAQGGPLKRERTKQGRFTGDVAGKRSRGRVKMLYTFARTAAIDDRLKFEVNVQGVAIKAWPTSFGRAFEAAMRTAK
jgi:hypothetical protein